MGIVAFVFAKCSIGALLPRVLANTSKWRLGFIAVNLAIYVALTVVNVGFTIGECTPAKALWEPELQLMGRAICHTRTEVNLSILQTSKLVPSRLPR